MQSLLSYTSCLFSRSLNDNIVDMQKPDEICSLTSVAHDSTGLFLHPSFLSVKDSKFT